MYAQREFPCDVLYITCVSFDIFAPCNIKQRTTATHSIVVYCPMILDQDAQGKEETIVEHQELRVCMHTFRKYFGRCHYGQLGIVSCASKELSISGDRTSNYCTIRLYMDLHPSIYCNI